MIIAITGVVLDGTTPVTDEQAQQVLTIPEGEYSEVTIAVTGEDGEPFDLTGYETFLCVRRSSSSAAIINRTGSLLVAASGTAKYILVGGDTDGQKGNYYYDVFIIETATSKTYRVVPKSRFVVADSMFDLDEDVSSPGPDVALIGLPAGGAVGQHPVITDDAPLTMGWEDAPEDDGAVGAVVLWSSDKDWDDVWAELTAAGGYGVVLIPSESIVTVTGTGPYDLSGVKFIGVGDRSELDFDPGVLIDGGDVVVLDCENLLVYGQAPMMTPGTKAVKIRFSRALFSNYASASPLFTSSSVDNLISLSASSLDASSGGTAILNLSTSAGRLAVYLAGGGVTPQIPAVATTDVITGAAGSNVAILTDALSQFDALAMVAAGPTVAAATDQFGRLGLPNYTAAQIAAQTPSADRKGQVSFDTTYGLPKVSDGVVWKNLLAESQSAVKTTTYTARLGEVVLVDPTGGAFAVTLPAASGHIARVVVKNQSASANAVTVTPTGGDTIDGAASGSLAAARSVSTYLSDGVSDWMLVATAGAGGGAGDMVLADVQTVTGAKTFNAGKLKVSNSGNTFATIMASLATESRTWSLPDATDTAVGLAASQNLLNKTLTTPAISGAMVQTSSAIGTAQTAGISATNSTAAADGAQQYSPMIELEGRGWKTDATAASLSTKWALQTVPIQGAAAPTSKLSFVQNIDGGSYTERLAVLSGGGIATASVGPNSTQQHTLPAVTSDTVALIAASQTLTNKTISGASNTLSAIAQSSVTNLVSDLAAKLSGTMASGLVPYGTGAATLAQSALTWNNSTLRLGVNSTTPANALDVRGSHSGDGIIHVQNTHSAGYSAITFHDTAGTYKGEIGYANTGVGNAGINSKMYLFSDAVDWVVSYNSTPRFTFGMATGEITIPATGKLITPTVGPAASQQHTLPAVTSDTVALLAATQTLAAKTLTAPVINGATSSGSTSLDFSGSSGTWKTSTGAHTFGSASWAVPANTVVTGAVSATQTTGLSLLSNTADGSTSIGVLVKNLTSLANAGARALSVNNNGTELFSVRASGDARMEVNGGAVLSPNGGNGILFYNSILVMQGAGIRPDTAGTQAMGGSGFTWAEVASRLYTTDNPATVSIASNAIAPVRYITHVGAGLIKTITIPTASFNGQIILWPDAAFTYDNTGNIVVAAGSGTAVVDRPMTATYDFLISKWSMSY